MPITDGWLNVFRLDDDTPIQAPDADMQAVGEPFRGDGPAAWLATTVADALAAMDASGTERAVLTVGDGASSARADAVSLLSVEDGVEACRRAPDRLRLTLQIQDVSSPHAAARLVREHGSRDEVVAVGVMPSYVGCDLDDRKLYPVYDACIEQGLPVRINIGIAGPALPSKHQHPELLEDLLLDFPELTVVGCHMGHPYEALVIRLLMKFPNLFLLTSGYLPTYFDPAVVRFMGSSRGIGRVLFASDHPGIPLPKAIAAARKLPLSDDALDQYLGTALGAVLGVEVMAVIDEEMTVRSAVDTLLASIGDLTPAEVWGATFDAGLTRVDFPVGLGGLGARPELQWVVDDALRAAGVPSGFSTNISGYGVVAPVIAAFGTAEQHARYLRRIFTCDDIWCQLFSEPDAGSDLASLQMRAERDGDGWRLTGQKVWNTMAHVADFGLLLARTSDAPRHRGITCFLLDMHAPGVEVRGIRQMTGDAEFNEVILDGALVPDAARVGEVDEGWGVALGTLMAERFAVNQVLDSETPFIDEVIGLWRSLPAPARRGSDRQRLAQLVIRSRLLDLMRARVEADARDGVHGPEGSIMKLLQSELTPDIFELGLDLLGAGGLLIGSYDVPRPTSWADAGAKSGDVRRAFLRSRAYPIEGGSVEIQRNTIGERILGLPRDR